MAWRIFGGKLGAKKENDVDRHPDKKSTTIPDKQGDQKWSFSAILYKILQAGSIYSLAPRCSSSAMGQFFDVHNHSGYAHIFDGT